MGGNALRLPKELFLQDAVSLAPQLLGKLVCHRVGEEVCRLRITETEAYFTAQDTACHAHKGRTKRTETLYAEGGIAYVYLCYGIHSLLNVVSGEKGIPQAVLIRCCEGYNGPGKLTKALGVTCQQNTEDLITSERLWLEDDGASWDYTTATRVGIGYASQEDQNRLWRFIAKK